MAKNGKRIMFICAGNICRSPAAHAVMQQIQQQRGLDWQVDSCGTLDYHQGSPPDSRMARVLEQHDISFRHAAQPFRLQMAYDFDLLLVMDMQNYTDIERKLPHDPELLDKLQLFRNYDPQIAPGSQSDVPDPYYYNGNRGFQDVYQMILRTCENLADRLG